MRIRISWWVTIVSRPTSTELAALMEFHLEVPSRTMSEIDLNDGSDVLLERDRSTRRSTRILGNAWIRALGRVFLDPMYTQTSPYVGKNVPVTGHRYQFLLILNFFLACVKRND